MYVNIYKISIIIISISAVMQGCGITCLESSLNFVHVAV